MPNMSIKRYNGDTWDAYYPKTTIGQVENLSSILADLQSEVQDFVYAAKNDGTSGLWHYTNANIDAYVDGMAVVLLVNNVAGSSSGTKFEINNLGSYNIYYTNDSKMTTHYGGYTTVVLSWEAERSRWYCHDFYDSTDDYRIRWQNDIVMGAYIHGYQLLVEGIDGKFYPVTEGGSSGNTNAISTAALQPGGKMLYYESGTDLAANTDGSGYEIYESINSSTMEYWNNRDSGWAQDWLPIYLVGTIDANGAFKLDNSNYTNFLTQTLPSTDDGKVYWQIGFMNNTYDNFRLTTDHPMFQFKDGKLRLYIPDHKHSFTEITGVINHAQLPFATATEKGAVRVVSSGSGLTKKLTIYTD